MPAETGLAETEFSASDHTETEIDEMVMAYGLPEIKEIEEDQNTALAILIGSVILGLAIIISAAIGG